MRDAGFLPLVERLWARGGERLALHLRGPGLPGRVLWEAARSAAPLAAAHGSLLVVNDRADVARAAGAGAVQLGARSLAPADARRVAPGLLLGASVHDAGEARAAVRAGADYLVAGTLYPTPSHPGRTGSGPGWMRELRPLGVPVVGIGGVTPDRVAAVREAGGAGVAVMRGVWDAPDPAAAVDRYLYAWEVANGDH